MALLYINKIPADQQKAFITKLNDIAAKLKLNPNWIMQVMDKESKVNPQAKNFQGGRLVAVGLIQWTKPGATHSGTTMESLEKMNAVQQLDYVYNYFKPYAGRIKQFEDLHLVTFWPVALGKRDSYVMQSKGMSAALVAKQNKIFDLNKDRQITVGEFKRHVRKSIPGQYRDLVLIKPLTPPVAGIMF